MGKRKNDFRKGFRKNKKTKHPAYTYSSRGGKYQYVSLTHSSIFDNKDTIALSHNPNPKDDKKAYILPDPYEDKKSNFSRRLNWKIHADDKHKFDSVKNKPIKKK